MINQQQQPIDSEVKMAASSTFDYILELIKTSNLNFWIQLSPFAATISLKKSLVKDVSGLPLMPPVFNREIKPECDTVAHQKVSKLEAALETMKLNCADTIDECAKAHQSIANLEAEVDNMRAKKDENKSVHQNQLADLSERIKILEESNNKLYADNNRLVLENEAETKKSNLISNRLNQELSELREKHQIEKAQIVQNHKLEVKSWKNDLGVERRENSKLEKQLESLRKELGKKASTKNCSIQTDQHPEIPYSIVDPLPPIFSSQLCYSSRRIGYISKSIPNFNTMCWVKPDDTFEDEAQEALNDQYDRQIEEFYLAERERVKNLKAEHLETGIVPGTTLNHLEGHIILNIESSSRDSSTTASEDGDY